MPASVRKECEILCLEARHVTYVGLLPVRDKSGVCRVRYETGRMWRSSAAATWEWSTSAEKGQDDIIHVTEMILKWIKTGSVRLLQKAVTILTRLNWERR